MDPMCRATQQQQQQQPPPPRAALQAGPPASEKSSPSLVVTPPDRRSVQTALAVGAASPPQPVAAPSTPTPPSTAEARSQFSSVDSVVRVGDNKTSRRFDSLMSTGRITAATAAAALAAVAAAEEAERQGPALQSCPCVFALCLHVVVLTVSVCIGSRLCVRCKISPLLAHRSWTMSTTCMCIRSLSI